MSVFTVQYLTECKVDGLTAWSQTLSKSGHLIFAMKKSHLGNEASIYYDFVRIIEYLDEHDILYTIRRSVSSDNQQPGQEVGSTFCTVEEVRDYFVRSLD